MTVATYDLIYPNNKKVRRDLTDEQLRHMERAAKHPKARLKKVVPVDEKKGGDA